MGSGCWWLFFSYKRVLTIQTMGSRRKFLIHWEDSLDLVVTWKNATCVRIEYPNFNLEGKVDFHGGVMLWFKIAYEKIHLAQHNWLRQMDKWLVILKSMELAWCINRKMTINNGHDVKWRSLSSLPLILSKSFSIFL